MGFINNLTRLGSEVEMATVNIWIVMLFFSSINCVALVTKSARNRPLRLPQLPVCFGFVIISPIIAGL